MKDKIVSGNIKNIESGEVTAFNHYLFCGGFELNTFVRIEKVESYIHPDKAMHIAIDCIALDSYGFVFKLGLEFHFSQNREDARIKILSDMTVGAILSIKGQYSMIPKDGSVTVYEPRYTQLPPDFSIEEAQEVFKNNWKQSGERGK